MPQRIQVRRGTAAEWTAANPVLANAEPGLESDTKKVKYGDGTTAWSSLGYASGGESGGGSNVQADWNAIGTAAEILNKPTLLVPYTMGLLTEDFEDTNYVIPFTGSGERATDEKHSGTYSWKHDALVRDTTPLETVFTINNPIGGELSFWYKRQNETDDIVFTDFILDDVVISHFSGANEWTKFTTIISEGAHIFKIKNTKVGGPGYWVKLWIDDMSIPATKVEHPNMPAMNGNGGKIVAVKADSTGWEYVTPPTGGSGGGSGGGSFAYTNPIDAPPAIPHANDDEFTVESLDVKWAYVNQGALSALLDGNSLQLKTPVGGVVCRGIVQPIPVSTDFTVVTKYLGSEYWGSYAKAGLLISESLTGKQLGIWHAYDGAWKGLMGEFFTTPASRSDFSYYGFPVEPHGGYIKARVYQLEGAWYVDFYYSLNGRAWVLEKSGLALGFTPAYVGVGCDLEYGTGTFYSFYFDWFRIVA